MRHANSVSGCQSWISSIRRWVWPFLLLVSTGAVWFGTGIARSDEDLPVATDSSETDEEPAVKPSAMQSQGDDFRTDTERMSDLEERFNALEGQLKATQPKAD